MDIQLGAPHRFALLLAVVAGIVLAAYAGASRRRHAARFATKNLHALVLPSSGVSRILSVILVLSGMAALALALVDIRWGKSPQVTPQRGIEVMFALDVSRSMLAEDTTPSRLERAKQQITDALDEMAGDRVGLVVFAGDARQMVPLTSHYEHFKQVLETVGPHSVRRGGSRLGDAIRTAGQCFLDKTRDHQAIVLFTDGEDQESQPVEVARELRVNQGVRIFTVGLGDMDRGSRIPSDEGEPSVGSENRERGRFVEYQGRQVWSKLDGAVLRSIAESTGGAYIPAGTKQVDMASVYHDYIASIPQLEFEAAQFDAYVPRFRWFAWPALLMVAMELWLATRDNEMSATREDD